MIARGKGIPEVSGGGFLGHVRELRSDPIGFMRRLNRECGDFGRFRILNVGILVPNTPALVEEVLVHRARSFKKSRWLRTALKPLAGEGLFTSEGELWRRQRKLMAPLFQPAHLAPYAAPMVDCAARCVATWRDGETVDVARETTRITMAISGKTLFDADTFDESDDLGVALGAGLRWASEAAVSFPLFAQVALGAMLGRVSSRIGDALESPVLWPGARTRRLREAVRVLDGRVRRMIEERRATGSKRGDLLSRLLDARDADDGRGMSDKQLRDEVTTLFVAGFETTATALVWAFYLLARHPAVLARLEAEVAALGGRTPAGADLPRLVYATQVFKETLRLYPPVPFMEREATEAVEVGGHRFRRGAYFDVLPWTLHRRETFWPEPDRFDPDRFTPEAEARRHRLAWIPFGAGPRVCIGNQFALMEGPLVLATIVQRARLEMIGGGDAEILPDPHAATWRPRGGMPMRVRLRERPLTARG